MFLEIKKKETVTLKGTARLSLIHCFAATITILKTLSYNFMLYLESSKFSTPYLIVF